MVCADILSRVMLYGTSTTCVFTFLLWHRSSVPRILSLIAHVDSRISTDSSFIVKTRKFINFVVIVLVILVVAFFCFHERVYGVGVILYIILFDELAHFIIFVSDIQFISIVLLLKNRYKLLNENLHSFLRKRYSNEIRALREVVSNMHDICRFVNDVYGFILFLECTSILISLVSTFYNMILHLRNTLKLQRETGVSTTLCHILWLLFYIGKLLGICASTHSATSESIISQSLVQK
ncbi:hypothetical protein L9F63_008864, partial [Diploptera punctata]